MAYRQNSAQTDPHDISRSKHYPPAGYNRRRVIVYLHCADAVSLQNKYKQIDVKWTAEQRTTRWLVHWPLMDGLYSKKGPGRAAAPPSPLRAVPNVTAHPSTASVPTSYYSMWRYKYLCTRCPVSGIHSLIQSPMIWTSLHLFSNPDLKHSSTQVSINNHSVTLIAPAIRLIGQHRLRLVVKFVCLLTYLLQG